jgi:hypothetical protein
MQAWCIARDAKAAYTVADEHAPLVSVRIVWVCDVKVIVVFRGIFDWLRDSTTGRWLRLGLPVPTETTGVEEVSSKQNTTGSKPD